MQTQDKYLGQAVQAKCFNYKTGTIIGYNPKARYGKRWHIRYEKPYTYAGKDCYTAWLQGNSLVVVSDPGCVDASIRPGLDE